MRTKFVEATQAVDGGFNHGKFMVGYFDADEWAHRCELGAEMGNTRSLIGRCGWTLQHALVFDLQTGEGALFRPGGSPAADLDKHKIWVCPMYEPFLAWLYEHVGKCFHMLMPDGMPAWFEELPLLVELPGAPVAMAGYRRAGV